ncbi:Aspyridones efflux protein apdF [Pseudocercospora fuligena]|uniref:Aspyridones efflux protein apdF n=1 Tax=Pseudocercospora fuligena TaxID=685502 RepID=A0A8H6RVP8_9PEZI|nr:Aspyridones efflux protein apdF [Pseudocercospora fuligena]
MPQSTEMTLEFEDNVSSDRAPLRSFSYSSPPLFDRGLIKALLYIDCALTFVGLLALSFEDQLWQIVLSQSVCVGLGSGLVFVPAVAMAASTFIAWQPIARGIASTGSAVGGTVLPLGFQALISKLGTAWTNRIFSFVTLATSALAILTLGWETTTSARARQSSTLFLDISAFRGPSYLFLCAGLFLVELVFWIQDFLIAPYAQFALSSSSQYVFYLLAILNAGYPAGRILPAFVAQMPKIGPAWTLFAGSAILGILVFCWIAIDDVIAITVWAVLVGFTSGIAVSIPKTVVPKLSAPKNVDTRSGTLWTTVAFAALIGAPIAGMMVDTEDGSYKGGQMFGGAIICAGSILLCVPASKMERGAHRE